MRLNTPAINCNPTEIKLHQVSRMLEISFDDGRTFNLPYEYLRVYTPSAEAIGHGPGQEILQTGKEHVTITALKPIGNYAVAPTFSDGHNTGIYSWALLYQLGNEQQNLWQAYLDKLKAAGYQRSGRTKD